jgi:hypothetical protein
MRLEAVGYKIRLEGVVQPLGRIRDKGLSLVAMYPSLES